MKPKTREEILALGFTEAEATLLTTPFRKIPAAQVPQVLALTERLRETAKAKVDAEYTPTPRNWTGFNISDHAEGSGGNLWHPAANSYVGSKSKFRAETRARGLNEVGNEYAKVAQSDDYHLPKTQESIAAQRVAVDKAMRFVDRNSASLVPGVKG